MRFFSGGVEIFSGGVEIFSGGGGGVEKILREIAKVQGWG